jgi:hypothetical protein
MGYDELLMQLPGRSHKPSGTTDVSATGKSATPGKRTLAESSRSGATVDPRPNEAIRQLRVAEVGLDTMCAMDDLLEDRARSGDPAPVVALARSIVPIHQPVIEALTEAVRSLREYEQDVSDETQRPVATVAAETIRIPGMRRAVDRVTSKLAQYVSTMDAVRAQHPQINDVLSDGRYLSMLQVLNRVRGAFDLETHTRESLKSLVEVVSHSNVLDLDGSSHTDVIQDAVNAVASAWNQRVTHFALAVSEFVQIIQEEDLDRAGSGLIDLVWSAGKKVLAKGSAYLSGTSLGATVGFAALERLHAHERAREQSREQADERVFVAELRRRVTELQREGIAPGGNQYISEWVRKLKQEFHDVAKADPTAHEESAFKNGDRVVFGAQADYLRTLTQGATEYQASIPTTETFTGGFLVEWINANHKRKQSGPIRSPFADSSHWDGYIACKIQLHPWASGWTILPGATAKLHCPKSDAVARALMRTHDPFHVGKVECPVHVEVACTDRDHLPPFLESAVPFTVQLDAARRVVGAGWLHEAWSWVQRETGLGADDILLRYRNLSG